MLDQDRLAGAITSEHPTDLRDSGVRLVDHQQEILWEKIDQRARARAGRAGVEVARIILDAGAETHLKHHLEVVRGAHPDALGLEQPPVFLQLSDAVAKLVSNGHEGAFDIFHRRDELLAWKDNNARQRFECAAGERVKLGDSIDLVTEKLNANPLFGFRRANLDRVPAHAELASLELNVVTLVLNLNQARQQALPPELLTDAESNDHLLEVAFFTDTVNARDACDDDHISPGEKRTHRRKAQTLDLVVDARVLLNERVGLRNVGFRLVVVEVTHKILDSVFREEPLELGV